MSTTNSNESLSKTVEPELYLPIVADWYEYQSKITKLTYKILIEEKRELTTYKKQSEEYLASLKRDLEKYELLLENVRECFKVMGVPEPTVFSFL
jgi:hypothetical protein